MGRKVMNGNTKKMMPQKLETWRVTSPDRVALERLAEMYGGEVNPWMDDYGKATGEFEVILKTNEVAIQLWGLAKQMGYMHWNHDKKMYDRQCDGQDSCWIIERGEKGQLRRESHCLCNAGEIAKEQDGCKLQTSLEFTVAGLPSFGGWKLTFSGANGYQEFPLAVESLLRIYGKGCLAVLRLAKRTGPDGNGNNVVYMVPEVDVRANLGEHVQSIGGVSMESLPGVRLQVIDAGALPSAAPQLPPASEPEDVEDEEDERITDDSTGEILGTVTDTARGQSLNGSSATAEHIAGQVVDTPKGFDLTPEASAFLETCQISPKIEDEFLREVEKLCGAKGYTLSEYLVLCVGKYKTKTLIKAFAQDVKPKGTPEA